MVREAVAENTQTPEEILHVLAQDPATRVKQSAVLTLRLLTEIEGLEYEGREENWRKQLSIWQVPSYPDLLTISEQLQVVSENEHMPAPVRQAVITALAGDWEAFLVSANWGEVFGKTLMLILLTEPPPALQKLAFADWTLRYLMALHPHTPRATRQQLRQDGNRYVRAMARAITEEQPAPDTR